MNRRSEDRSVRRISVRMPRFTLRNLRRLGWFLFYTTNVVLLAGALIAARWWYVNQLPESAIPRIPPATLPTENGFDKLTTIGAKIVRPIDVAFAIQRQNAHHKPDRVYTPEERQALVRENAPILASARQAFSLPCASPPYRYYQKQPYHEPGPEYRGLARLFVLDGYTAEEKGDYGHAADAYLDAMALNDKVANGGGLIPKLVGLACEAMGRARLLPLVDKLSVVETRHATSRLEAHMSGWVSLASTLEQEKWDNQATFAGIFRKRSLDQVMNDGMDSGEAVADFFSGMMGQAHEKSLLDRLLIPVRHGALFFVSLRSTKTEILQENARYMDESIARAKKPYSAVSVPPRQPRDLVNRMLMPVFDQARHKDADSATQDALLLAKLALHAYRTEHGTYPESLTDLVTAKILKRVPVDPFGTSANSALHYHRLAGDGYLLYSIGPDGKDDQGTPIDNHYDDGRQKHWTNPDSKGDIVLGINL